MGEVRQRWREREPRRWRDRQRQRQRQSDRDRESEAGIYSERDKEIEERDWGGWKARDTLLAFRVEPIHLLGKLLG